MLPPVQRPCRLVRLLHPTALTWSPAPQGDTRMLTASGDQSVSLWDTGHADLLGSFRGHSGSVKTVSPMPAVHDVFASGARDGALMVWDARGSAVRDATSGELFHAPVITVQASRGTVRTCVYMCSCFVCSGRLCLGAVGPSILLSGLRSVYASLGAQPASPLPLPGPPALPQDAHAPSAKQKRRRTPLQGRTRPSVTSLTFLQGGSQLATGGGQPQWGDQRRPSFWSCLVAARWHRTGCFLPRQLIVPPLIISFPFFLPHQCAPGVDGVVKFWDLRRTAAPVGEAAPWLELERLCDAGVPPISQKQHGITSLALHPQGGQQGRSQGRLWLAPAGWGRQTAGSVAASSWQPGSSLSAGAACRRRAGGNDCLRSSRSNGT